MIPPDQIRPLVAVFFASLLTRPVAQVVAVLSGSVRGAAYLALILCGVAALVQTGKTVRSLTAATPGRDRPPA